MTPGLHDAAPRPHSCLQAQAQPATTVLCVALAALFPALLRRDVGLSYSAVVEHREYWRGGAAQLAHVDLIHLAFNLSALWSIGIVERTHDLGVLYYLRTTALLLLLSPVVRGRAEQGWAGPGSRLPNKGHVRNSQAGAATFRVTAAACSEPTCAAPNPPTVTAWADDAPDLLPAHPRGPQAGVCAHLRRRLLVRALWVDGAAVLPTAPRCVLG